MTPRHEARLALTGALMCLSYPTDSDAMEALRRLAQRFLDLAPDAPDEEFRTIAELARAVRFRLEFGLALLD